MPWCSGYHICLTRRRSRVQAWVASVFYRLTFFAFYSLVECQTKNQSKSSLTQEALNNEIKPIDHLFKKKNFRLHKNNKNTICYSISPWTNNLMKWQLTIHICKCEMILSSKLFNLILHAKLFFQVWEGNDQKKFKQKKPKDNPLQLN